MQICLFEDEQYKNFLPLVYFRPVYDLRCGIYSFRQKIENLFPKVKIIYNLRTELEPFFKEENPDKIVNQIPHEDVWFINGRVIPDDNLLRKVKGKNQQDLLLMNGKNIVALFLKKESLQQFKNLFTCGVLRQKDFRSIQQENIDTQMVSYPWDIVHLTSQEIISEYSFFKTKNKSLNKNFKGVHLLNKKHIFIGKNATLKPGVVIDAENGPVVIGKNATIMSNAVIEGPAFIGDNSIVKVGAKIYHGTSIGEWCKVGGEIEASVIQSYSNKQHEGFLGHSFLGSWVNLGADTNTSDLKNNYSTVRVQINGETVDSGMQFVGLTMGDHSKSGINMMFDTGTVVGVSCNLYGAGLPPKYIPSYCWGGEKSLTIYDIDKSIETMKKVMARRKVEMTKAYEMLARGIFSATMNERKNIGIE
jgi:UDP-N-acetylglucosamine diphosphorylase / glucose-1-phosphate thymidylyltransferase / UDP-N-acetylgalactosamine diphosphorylase / glucosamine-1-phosphate N-acetyltransferase / galactosamine-1-phosphate N-acetyltransferase